MRRSLYAGVTAERDMADDLRTIVELAREALVGEIPGPDLYYAALMAGPSFFDDPGTIAVEAGTEGKSGVEGKRVSGSIELGGRRIIKKTKTPQTKEDDRT